MDDFNLNDYREYLKGCKKIGECRKIDPTREEDSNYIVISYSSKDFKKVYSDIANFKDKRIRFWYDMGIGGVGANELWKQSAMDAIEDSKCTGVIFYLSEDFFASDQTLFEVKKVKELEKNFFAVNLTNIKEISKICAASATKENTDADKIFARYEETYKQMFSQEAHYLSFDDIDHDKMIIEEIKNKFNVTPGTKQGYVLDISEEKALHGKILSSKYPERKYDAYFDLIKLYRTNGKFKKAEETCDELFDAIKKAESVRYDILLRISDEYFSLRQFNKYCESFSIAEAGIKQDYSRARKYGELFSIPEFGIKHSYVRTLIEKYLEKGMNGSAIRLLEESSGNNDLKMEAYYNIGNYEKAYKYACDARTEFDEIDDTDYDYYDYLDCANLSLSKIIFSCKYYLICIDRKKEETLNDIFPDFDLEFENEISGLFSNAEHCVDYIYEVLSRDYDDFINEDIKKDDNYYSEIVDFVEKMMYMFYLIVQIRDSVYSFRNKFKSQTKAVCLSIGTVIDMFDRVSSKSFLRDSLINDYMISKYTVFVKNEEYEKEILMSKELLKYDFRRILLIKKRNMIRYLPYKIDENCVFTKELFDAGYLGCFDNLLYYFIKQKDFDNYMAVLEKCRNEILDRDYLSLEIKALKIIKDGVLFKAKSSEALQKIKKINTVSQFDLANLYLDYIISADDMQSENKSDYDDAWREFKKIFNEFNNMKMYKHCARLIERCREIAYFQSMSSEKINEYITGTTNNEIMREIVDF